MLPFTNNGVLHQPGCKHVFTMGRWQAYSTLIYKLGAAADGFTKPVITLEYVGTHYSNPSFPGAAWATKILPKAAYLAETRNMHGCLCHQTTRRLDLDHIHPPPPAGNRPSSSSRLDRNHVEGAC